MFVLVSGASGSGKSTIIKAVLKKFGKLIALLPSSTSRPKRPGEVEGGSYYYLTKKEFEDAIANGEFIEYQKVHSNGHYYGVHKKRYQEYSKKYPILIKDVDVLGVMEIVRLGYDCVTIYIDIKDDESLISRLRHRGDSEAEIEIRLERKAFEDSFRDKYDYVVSNDNLKKAINEVCEIIKKEYNERKQGEK